MRTLIILVNNIDMSGPIKGAYALFKQIKITAHEHNCKVKLISLGKPPAIFPDCYDKNLLLEVKYLNCDGWHRLPLAIVRYIYILLRSKPNAVLSFGFRANILNCIRFLGVTRIAAIRASTLKEPIEFDYASSHFRRWFGIHVGYAVIGFKDVAVYLFEQMIENDCDNFFIKPKKFIAIPNFLDEEETVALSKSPCNLLISKVGSNNSKPFHFITIALLNRKKNISELINAFFDVVIYEKNVNLTVVGDGSELKKLILQARALQIENKIQFLGYIKNPLPLLKKMDCLVLSSLTDATPRAALEAIHLGVPVIVPELVGLSELVTESNGIVYQRGNLSKAMTTMIESRDKFSPALPPVFRQKDAVRRYLELF